MSAHAQTLFSSVCWLLYNLQLPVLHVENRSIPGEKQLCHNRSAGQLSDHDFPRRIEWQDRCFVCRRIFRVLSNSRCRQQYFHGDQRHVRVEVVFLKRVLAPAIKWTKESPVHSCAEPVSGIQSKCPFKASSWPFSDAKRLPLNHFLL